MEKITLKDFANDFSKMWLEELIPKSRAFPSYKDGLKEPTRAIVTALARLSDFEIRTVEAAVLIDKVPSYKEAGHKNIAKNVFRLASGNTPLIQVVAKEGLKVKGLNRISGNHSQPRYVGLSLTPLGQYIFKYRDYFETTPSDVDLNLLKYKEIKTPIPLSLLIPQVNLSDGFSNKAPNLNILEVLDAYIEHLMKDKKTTTQDLAKHIKGFEVTPGSKVLMSNQSLHDLIERGIAKAVTLAPVEFYENEIVIKDLPFRAFGTTIMNEFNKKHIEGVEGKREGFQSFLVKDITPEDSNESLITIIYQIKPGYTISDVKSEIYMKTSLKERIVYENICLDLDSNKPLTIKSIREILDYHVDLGIDLKSRRIRDDIALLEQERDDAELLEKLTREICVDIIGRIIGKRNRAQLAEKYLNNIHEIMLNVISNGDYPDFKEYEFIEDVVRKHEVKLKAMITKQYGSLTDEGIEEVLKTEVPNNFSKDQLSKLWQSKFNVLYDLNKRTKALKILQDFEANLKELEDKLDIDLLKKDLVDEINELKMYYRNAKFSETMYALKPHEREERKKIKQQMIYHMRRMEGEMPVNVLIDSNYKLHLSFSKSHEISDGIIQVMELTTEDKMAIINRNGSSYKVNVRDMPLTGLQLNNTEDILAITIDEYKAKFKAVYIFVTNKGRVILCDDMLMLFRDKHLNVALAPDERFVYHNVFSPNLFSDKIAVLLKTEDNLIKRKRLSEFVLKSRLNEFFNLFAGNSATDFVTSATVMYSDYNMLGLWSDGFEKIIIDNGYKRNVSYGEKLPYDKKGAFMVDDLIPIVHNRVIPDLNSLLEVNHFNRLSTLLAEEDNKELSFALNKFTIADIKWAKFMTSMSRRALKLDFTPDHLQIEALISTFNGN